MSNHARGSVLERTHPQLREIVEKKGLLDAEVSVLAKPLTPEEAIGAPGRRDFPILIGKERVLEAKVKDAKGHAYTDSAQEYVGTLRDVLGLELNTNQNRAIYVATLNAVLAHLKMVAGTVHCKDEDPEECACEIAKHLHEKYGRVKVGLIGLNPAIAERLADQFGSDRVRVTDLFADNIGKIKFGVEIWDGATRTADLISSTDVTVFTGTTLVNGTFDGIWDTVRMHRKNYLVYGVTAAGVAELAGFARICPCGRDA